MCGDNKWDEQKKKKKLCGVPGRFVTTELVSSTAVVLIVGLDCEESARTLVVLDVDG